MREPALARRYAEALFLAARDRGVLDAVATDAAGLRDLLAAEPRLRRFLESPQVLTAEKEKLVRSTLGEGAEPLVRDLVLLLLRKQRVPYLNDVLQLFQERLDEHRGFVSATVTTAVPLPEELSEELRRRLEAREKLKVRLETRVDPRILGGVTVTIGDKVIDGSLRQELRELRRRMLETPL
ncbi:MAG: ATP synthase F1 subunit delta [Candidatus Eisenbacteria bacterium]|nr:ATP synthase F1 subunit delta [Candidatus Eisenbacteria bacterium]